MHYASSHPTSFIQSATILPMVTTLSRFSCVLDALEAAIQSQTALLDATLPFTTVKEIYEAGDVARAKAIACAESVAAAPKLTTDAKNLQAMAAQILMLLSWQANTMEKIVALFGAAVRTMTATKEGSPCHDQLSRGLALIDQVMEQQVNFLGLAHSSVRKVQ